MKKDSLILPAIILCVICLVTTGLVALTYTLTADARKMQVDITEKANLVLLCPEAASFEKSELSLAEQEATGITKAYIALDANKKPVAWLLTAQARGYGGAVPVLVVITADGKIDGLKILANNETPGLGMKVAEPAFYTQFVGQSIDKQFAVKTATEAQHRIDAVTGATVSSKAVAKAINLAVAYYQQKYAEVK